MLKKIKYYFKRLYGIIITPEIRVLPGHLAYFFVLSVVPTVTLLGYIATFFGVPISSIGEFLKNSFTAETASLFSPNLVGKSFDLRILSLIIIGYFIASNGAHSIILSSNRVYNIKDENFIKRRIKAIFMTFFIVVLFLFILLVPIFGSTIVRFIDKIDPTVNLMDQIRVFIPYIKGPITWFTIFVLIKIIYTMAPDKKIPSATVNRGTIFTTIMWTIVTYAYTYYAHNLANYDIFYGALTSIVVMMIWLYFLAYIFVVGIVLNYSTEQKEIRKKELETQELNLKKIKEEQNKK